MTFHINLANTPAQFFSPDAAERHAAEMNGDEDDDWTYVVEHDPKGTGYSLIAVYDEDGEFVGKV